MNQDYIVQHTPSSIARWLNGVFPYTQVKWGNIKNGEGDVVVINLGKNDFVSFEEYMRHTHSIDRIVQIGIYTNIYFTRKFFADSVALIAGLPTSSK